MVTARELAEAVCAIAPTDLTYGPARPGEVPSALVTSNRAKSELGWGDRVRFEDGLREIFEEERASILV